MKHILNNDISDDLSDGINTWQVINDGTMPLYHLYYYYPKSIRNVNDKQAWARSFIWNFKDGANADEAAKEVTTVLKHFFLADSLKELTFLCIPASTEAKTKKRYTKFIKKVISECGMQKGNEHLKVAFDREARHLGGEQNFDNLDFQDTWFDGRTVIIFDDVTTTGSSLKYMKEKLESLNAKVLCAITLGLTTHEDMGEDPYDCMDKSVKKKKTKKTKDNKEELPATVIESCRQYEALGDVSQVAQARGLTEATIYGHLFRSQVLNPCQFISIKNLINAFIIYESGTEEPSKKLHSFLSSSELAAFYYIKHMNWKIDETGKTEN